ncbi:DUF1178 domain-containing protein [Paucibacter sp. KBW04]|uniref:DUF1178 family protein n=1 Tax=Paucibacter sp. KBW04 TaxID=2153361 RepID=UPI000F5739C0|nr:DUF1178 family protein [Paucibacter sp. KBW04]RQO58564.1 DUF1178 domain-containing protein [Paucibacter sp. KBW04]
MLVLNLACSLDHRFEGWFGSHGDFQSQTERGLLSCPVCADAKVKRMPSAPHLNVSHLRQEAPAPARREAKRAEQGAAAAAGSKLSAPALAAPAPPAALQPIEAGLDPREQLQVLQAKLMQAVQQVIANTEDVGTQFAEEARRIHYGESPERDIRGQATMDEAAALEDEGISVIALPSALGHKGPLQ